MISYRDDYETYEAEVEMSYEDQMVWVYVPEADMLLFADAYALAVERDHEAAQQLLCSMEK